MTTRCRGQRKMLFSDPKSRWKFTDYMGQGPNSASQSDQTYDWTRGVQRLARYEPQHPLKVEARPYAIMEAFEDEVLPTKYRDLIEEFQAEEVDEEEMAAQQLFGQVSGVRQQFDDEGKLIPLEASQIPGDPAIASRLAELQRLLPSTTPNREALIQSLLQDFIRDRVSQGLGRRTNGGVQNGRQETVKRDAQNRAPAEGPVEEVVVPSGPAGPRAGEGAGPVGDEEGEAVDFR